MLKWIAGLGLVIALVVAFYFYQKFSAQIVRLTPEVVENLRATVARENESAINTPNIRERVIPDENPLNNLYFGDLHVHSAWSFDANLGGNRLGPVDAYRFAMGHEHEMMSGEVVQLSAPLDFAAVTDHAESFGLFEGCAASGLSAEQMEFCDLFENPSVSVFFKLRQNAINRPPIRPAHCGDDGSFCIEHGITTWNRMQQAADDAYQPGIFTSFYGYEYSPVWPKGGSTHRNIIFRNRTVPDRVISAYDAATALDLWRILEDTCIGDCDFITIPHNLNRYYGKAFSRTDEDGGEYSIEDWKRRKKYEPLVEVFQVKGNSECAVGVGTTDEECNFEQFFPTCKDGQTEGCAGPGSYARDGLKFGLELEEELGFNPLRIGLVGSTDAHNSNPGDTEEWDYRGKSGFKDASAEKRMEVRKRAPGTPINHNPGGLAAIWAEKNTRDALFDSLERKETYATSGTRIQLRFFAGWNLTDDLLTDANWLEKAYESAVPMGGVLDSGIVEHNPAEKPELLVWVTKDPNNAGLDRVQVIKGWFDDGEQREEIYDVACGGGRLPVAGTCPDNSAGVNLETCEISSVENESDAELKVVWEDRGFKPGQSAFYYVRVMQNPTCRWSSYDAIRLGIKAIPEVPSAIKERAWSSPIWYSPAGFQDEYAGIDSN